ncbi:MAG: hypothetical protein K9W46_01720 [Candidatus Heimdallarchaeum endolithica]|uniref:Uncharacterized protein n=1 Tax=Candidatus Heimdallarchaeum endolithica TaxID=2876572 RepID=A0A9Y1BRN7_9ARCH|nr:MAG: hypothetical protein K9W46_01720 [Candidatus Heimdallarchaeum endolithica]
MSDKLIVELEETLIPYALERFNFQNNPAVRNITSNPIFRSMLGKTLDHAQQYVTDFVTWLCRAFVRVLVNSNISLKLSDIATLILAESFLMMDLPPYGYGGSSNDGDKSDTKVMIEVEVHRWFVFLEKEGKLPGIYNRFTGVYSTN